MTYYVKYEGMRGADKLEAQTLEDAKKEAGSRQYFGSGMAEICKRVKADMYNPDGLMTICSREIIQWPGGWGYGQWEYGW